MRQRQQFRRRPLDEEDAGADGAGDAPAAVAPAKKAQAPKPTATLLSFADDGEDGGQEAGVRKRVVAAAVRVSGAEAVAGGEKGLRSAGEYSAQRLREVRLVLVFKQRRVNGSTQLTLGVCVHSWRRRSARCQAP